MSEWIDPAASSAVWPERSVHALVSFSPAVKNVIRSSASRSRRTTSSSAESPPSRKDAASSSGSSASSASSFRSMPAGPVDDGEQRLRRQRLELGRKLARVVGERLAGVDVRQHVRELVDLGAQACVARLRLLRHTLEPSLDVIAVGDEQLEAERLEIAVRIRVRPEAAQDDEQRVDLAQVSELRVAAAGDVLHPDRRRRDLARVHDLGQRLEAVVGDRRDPHVRLAVLAARGLRQRGEQRRLAAAGRTDDPDLERHRAGPSAVRAETDAALASEPLDVDDAPQQHRVPPVLGVEGERAVAGARERTVELVGGLRR